MYFESFSQRLFWITAVESYFEYFLYCTFVCNCTLAQTLFAFLFWSFKRACSRRKLRKSFLKNPISTALNSQYILHFMFIHTKLHPACTVDFSLPHPRSVFHSSFYACMFTLLWPYNLMSLVRVWFRGCMRTIDTLSN